MASLVEFSLSYKGAIADAHEIDLYDVGQALIGFQRSLALTTHLVLNGEIITQAPSLKGATIVALPPEEGSWKLVAIVLGGLYTVAATPKDNALGHLISSGYDYMVSRTLGFHVDYDKSLGQQYDELHPTHEIKPLTKSKFDALAEKCEVAVKDMHRPIIWSRTAEQAYIVSKVGSQERKLPRPFDEITYERLRTIERDTQPQRYEGKVSSYNLNTFKGRIFLPDEQRPVPFELSPDARDRATVDKITRSLMRSARSSLDEHALIEFSAIAEHTSAGRLRNLVIVSLED